MTCPYCHARDPWIWMRWTAYETIVLFTETPKGRTRYAQLSAIIPAGIVRCTRCEQILRYDFGGQTYAAHCAAVAQEHAGKFHLTSSTRRRYEVTSLIYQLRDLFMRRPWRER